MLQRGNELVRIHPDNEIGFRIVFIVIKPFGLQVNDPVVLGMTKNVLDAVDDLIKVISEGDTEALEGVINELT